MNHKNIYHFACKLVLVTMALTSMAETTRAQNPSAYHVIKGIEDQFPIPTPFKKAKVGVFNPYLGQFTGLKTTQQVAGGGPKPVLIDVAPQVEVNAVHVGLVFEIPAPEKDFQVTVNGKTFTTTYGKTRIVADVGKATDVKWTIRANKQTYSDRILIKRPPLIGVGAFTIPALPIAIIYEPPQDSLKRNTVTYKTTKFISTKVGVSFSHEESETRPLFSPISELQSMMKGQAAILGDPEGIAELTGEKKGKAGSQAAAVGKLLTTIADALGKESKKKTQGKKVTKEHELELTIVTEDFTSLGSQLGPGLGDKIMFLSQAKLAWLAIGDKIYLSLLDHGPLEDPPVWLLKKDLMRSPTTTGLDHESIRALLQLDPFVGVIPDSTTVLGLPTIPIRKDLPYGIPGSTKTIAKLPPLPEDRFEYAEGKDRRFYQTHSINPSGIKFEHTIVETNTDATTEFTVKVEGYNAGMLSFLGLGIGETKSLKTTVTNSTSSKLSKGTKITTKVDFYAEGEENYTIEFYIDRIFGTVAMRKVPPLSTPVYSGVAKNNKGRILVNHDITLVIGKKKFTTTSDEKGRYAFDAATIPNGNGIVRIGKQKKQVKIKKK